MTTRTVPPDTGRLLTVEEFASLPDYENRTELVRGRLVREPPAGFEHGHLAAVVAHRLKSFADANDLGLVLAAETGFLLFDDPPTVRAPDAAFVAKERLPPDRHGFAHLAPDLAVEIVSPSNTVAQVQDKVCDYLDAGTRMVWIVEPRRQTVMVYRSRDDIHLLTGADVIDGGEVLPGFRLAVAELFAD